MIEIDGSFGEGGGQILRTAVSLAGVLGKDLRIHNIRAGRTPPGLKAQHLTSVRAAAEITQAKLEGPEVGSTEIVYRPSKLRSGKFLFDVGTAGSITLVLQTLMPIVAHAPGRVEVEITGGTDVKWSPPADYLSHVALRVLERMGYHARMEIGRRGHYPRGGGMVRFSVEPTERFERIVGLEAGGLRKISGVSHAIGLPRHVAERQSIAAKNVLRASGMPEPGIDIDWSEARSGMGAGSGVVLSAETEHASIIGADSLGERGRPAEDVGSMAAVKLVQEAESRAFLDRHMGDMVVPYMALAAGISEVTVSQLTQHTLTNAKVAEWVTGVKFEIDGTLGSKGRLRAAGLGLRNSSFSSPRGSTVAPSP